ncbi:MAG TPA: 6-bladed beta-propeller [Gemmatimonadales bacterium]
MIVLSTLSLGACGETGLRAANGGTWQLASAEVERWVASEPIVEIGVIEGNPDLELFEATSSIRLSDGRIVVANTGTSELRFFDRSGRFERAAGGRGGGPGEFRFLRRIARLPGDSILALDWIRASVFDPAGAFVRTQPIDQLSDIERLDLWVHGAFWVTASSERYSSLVITRALDRLPPPTGEPPYRVVVPTGSGDVWIREQAVDADGTRMWIVIDSTGLAAATIQLPHRFDVHSIGPDWVLGRWRNADDVNFIRLHRITRGEAPGSVPAWMRTAPLPTARVAMTDAQRESMRGAVHALVFAQEIHFARHARYAEDGDALEVELPEGVGANIVTGHRVGWLAAVWLAGARIVCGVAVGAVTPVDWNEGELNCQP